MRTLIFAVVLGLSTASVAQQVVAVPSLSPLVESVKAAVVNVDVAKRPSGPQQEMMERFLRRRPGAEAPLSPGTGSGFIIDPKGLMLTNNHVVADAVTIKVRLDDGRSFDGEVLGRDPQTDVALVKLKGKFDALPAVKLGDSSTIRVGDWVVAIGNPFGLAQSVSAGIISALDRQIGASRYDQFLQTDAAINPGNSGGPLFNLKGEVIGMNTAIIGAATGIGFAVPSTLMKALLPQLEKNGSVTRAWLGVGVQDVTPALGKALGISAREGAMISSVNSGGPGDKGGIKEEDIVVAIDGERVASSGALVRIVGVKHPDAMAKLSILRNGKPMELNVKLGVRPRDDDEEIISKSDKSDDSHRIGIAFQDLDVRQADSMGLPPKGALVVEVMPGSPAQEAGLHRGMVVVELNRKAISSRDELMKGLKALKPGDVALMRVALPGAASKTLIALEVP